MGFVGNYAPRGLSPQMYDMPVIHARACHDISRGRLFFYARTHGLCIGQRVTTRLRLLRYPPIISTPSDCFETSTWKFSNSSLENKNSPRRREMIPPKFHFIPPKFYFVPTWGFFCSSLGIWKSLGRDWETPRGGFQSSPKKWAGDSDLEIKTR